MYAFRLFVLITEYSGAYSQLAFAGKNEHDPVEGNMQTAKANLAKQLQMMSSNHPGQVQYFFTKTTHNSLPVIHYFTHIIIVLFYQLPGIMQSGLQPDALKFLQGYLSAANCQLS